MLNLVLLLNPEYLLNIANLMNLMILMNVMIDDSGEFCVSGDSSKSNNESGEHPPTPLYHHQHKAETGRSESHDRQTDRNTVEQYSLDSLKFLSSEFLLGADYEEDRGDTGRRLAKEYDFKLKSISLTLKLKKH